MSETYTLFSQVYLDPYSKCYLNIVTINKIPKGPLRTKVKKINFLPLSPFNTFNDCNYRKPCGLVLTNLNDPFCPRPLLVEETPDLFTYLTMNGYNIDTKLTNMMNKSDISIGNNQSAKILCFISYNCKPI